MEKSKNFRLAYLGAAPHSFYVAATWIISGILGDMYGWKVSVIFFLLAGFLNFPAGELLKKFVFRSSVKLDKENDFPLLLKLLSFTIPLSLPIIYFACKADINYFYPVFAMVIGSHYLPFYFSYRLPAFLIGGGLIWAAGCLIGLYFPGHFSWAAYSTGLIVLGMAIVNIRSVLAERKLLTAVDGKLHQV